MYQDLFAVAYGRVSTEDQARKELSVPAQFRRIEEFAEKNSPPIQIIFRDADEGVSAFKDSENREAFWRCVEVACKDKRVTLFLIDDSSRFFRDMYESGAAKAKLRRHGVRVLITSNPYDTTTIAGVWQEAVDSAKDQTSSMMTAFYTFRGMEENAQRRDSVTGWCFKNGGRAPFGYRSIHVVRGQDTRGRDIVKTLWEIEKEAAIVLRHMYVECRIKRQMSYKSIHEELNDLNMLSPTPGRPWTISSIIEMMREDRVLQNAGWYFWNKEDHKTPGRRFKDRSKWLKVENAHPGIITPEEAEEVIKINKLHSNDKAYPRANLSPYLLTGKNGAGEDMFVCMECGMRMTSHQPAKRSRKTYVCGNVHYRGKSVCIHKPIDKNWVEMFLLSKIREVFGSKAAASQIAEKINREIASANNNKALEKLNKQIQNIDSKITNLVRAIANGFDLDVAKGELDNLKFEKMNLEKQKTLIERETLVRKPVSVEEILRVYQNLEDAFELHDPHKKRKLLRAFVRRLEFDPRKDSLKVVLFAEPLTTVSVCILDGAQDRT